MCVFSPLGPLLQRPDFRLGRVLMILLDPQSSVAVRLPEVFLLRLPFQPRRELRETTPILTCEMSLHQLHCLVLDHPSSLFARQTAQSEAHRDCHSSLPREQMTENISQRLMHVCLKTQPARPANSLSFGTKVYVHLSSHTRGSFPPLILEPRLKGASPLSQNGYG